MNGTLSPTTSKWLADLSGRGFVRGNAQLLLPN